MLPTRIEHGALTVSFEKNGDVQLIRSTTTESIRVSCSEWEYLIRLAEIHNFPIAPPSGVPAT